MANGASVVISFVELEGFRGVRNRLRVDFAPGFTVITGRNGAGKSTICDAVEFALLGRLTKYEEGTEKGESIADYVWWRGRGSSPRRTVSLGFRTADGREVILTRGPNSASAEHDLEDIQRLLCDEEHSPSECVDQICRTAIIRDEWIASGSLDLSERQRYAFVRAAIGSDVLSAVEENGGAVYRSLGGHKSELTSQYEAARAEVRRLHRDLSEAKELAAEARDLDSAVQTLAGLLDMAGTHLPSTDHSDLAETVRRLIAGLRSELSEVLRLAEQAEKLRSERQALREIETSERYQELKNDLAMAKSSAKELQEARKNNELEISQLGASSEPMRSFASLWEHGQRVGLVDGRCPLCSLEQKSTHFKQALANLRSRVDENAQQWEALKSKSAELDRLLAVQQNLVKRLQDELQEIPELLQTNQAHSGRLIKEATSLGVELSQRLESVVFDVAVAEFRNRIGELERPLSILESSLAVERVKTFEQRIKAAQAESDLAEREIVKLDRAMERARGHIQGISRAVGEVVEERLAALEPLLQDLYSRIQPHVDWREVEYRLRGEVMRFLSLQVGENLNPRFIFSSGQRRAAGLAFLLAVYLSRPWCRLRTLIVDDPVQHIDDYRALHIVETLAAIRRAGHQLICTVEDPALAELLVRRLGTGPAPIGKFLELGYSPGEGASIQAERAVQPADSAVLVSA